MKITPLQGESLGTRSLATLVETPDLTLLLDPGSALGIRFGLLPHPQEYELMYKTTEHLCFNLANKVDVLFISHYHLDHYISTLTDFAYHWHTSEMAEALYTDKIIYVKHNRMNINYSQKKRGHYFEKQVAKLAKELIWCDDLHFTYNDTQIQFSPAVWHGTEKSSLGYIVQCCITEGDKAFVFSPDSQCLNHAAITWILAQNPDQLLIGGPPIYLLGWKVDQPTIDTAQQHLSQLMQQIPRIIIDHHLLRSTEWKVWLHETRDMAEPITSTCECMANYRGIAPKLLEAERESWYAQDPPPRDFLRWTKLARTIRARTPPPTVVH